MTEATPKPQVRRTLYHYMHIAGRHKYMLAVNFFATVIAVIVGGIIFRYFLAQLFEQLGQINNLPPGAAWDTFYLLVVLIAIEVFFWRINDYTYLYRQAKTLAKLERYALDKMQAHSYRFYSDNFAGSLVTQFSRFLKSYETLEDIVWFELLSAATTLIASIIVLLLIAPALGIALLVWSILFLATIIWLTIKKSPVTRQATHADSRVTAHAADIITNILNVKIFARRGYESKQFAKTSRDRYEKRWHSWKLDAHIRSIRWVFVIAFLLLYLSLSIKLISDGTISLAVVLTAQLYIMSIYNQLFNLNRTIERMMLAFADASEMTEILDREPEVKDPARPEKARFNEGLIEFEAVRFHYADANSAVLDDFNLVIKPGEKIGLVGHSGSGKSTLTRLLLRFADIQAGTIKIDGQATDAVTQDDLRSHIAYVPQEPMLFHRSLIDNIRYGRSEATDEEVHEAARLAHADDFIKNLPQGYDTMVGERGVKLSGGEKQRVAIARAMLSRAPILILDEATSALDSKSEKLITSALDTLMKNRTTIVVAHRLSTIRKLDRILVMENGNLIEDGSHDSLMAQKGVYADLWTHQSGGFLEE